MGSVELDKSLNDAQCAQSNNLLCLGGINFDSGKVLWFGAGLMIYHLILSVHMAVLNKS